MMADMAAMTSMTIALARLFGENISRPLARNLAMTSLKRAIVKHPVKMAIKEFSKFIPIVGSFTAPVISVAILESAGWYTVDEFKRKMK